MPVCLSTLLSSRFCRPHRAGHFAPGQLAVLPYQQMVAGLPRGGTALAASQPPPYKALRQPIIDT